MFKIDVPHPIGNRTFDTKADAARIGRAFGVDVRQIIEAKEEEEGQDD